MSIEVNKEALAALSIADLLLWKAEFHALYVRDENRYHAQCIQAILMELNKRELNIFIN